MDVTDFKKAFTVSAEIQNLRAQSTFDCVMQAAFGIHIQSM